MAITPPGSVGMESIADSHFMATPHQSPLPTAWNVRDIVPPLYKNTFDVSTYRLGWLFEGFTTADDVYMKRYHSISYSKTETSPTAFNGSYGCSYTGVGSNAGMSTTGSDDLASYSDCMVDAPDFPTKQSTFNSGTVGGNTQTYTDPPDAFTGTITGSLGGGINNNDMVTSAIMNPIWPDNVMDSYQAYYRSNSDGAEHGLNSSGQIDFGITIPQTTSDPIYWTDNWGYTGAYPVPLSFYAATFAASGAQPLDDGVYPTASGYGPTAVELAASLPLEPGQVLITSSLSFHNDSGAPAHPWLYQADFHAERIIWPWLTPQAYIVAEIVSGIFNDLSAGSGGWISNVDSGTLEYGQSKTLSSSTNMGLIPYHATDPSSGKDIVVVSVTRVLFVNQSFADFAATSYPGVSVV